jgi:hypothetical protein
MSDSILDKYVVPRQAKLPAPSEPELLEDFGAFGFLRGVRERALMLELRHRDGTLSAFGYSWLDRVTFDPSDGITVSFGRYKVIITGTNLNDEIRPNVRLFEGITRHRVPWIAESDGPALIEAGPGLPVVDRIKIED